MNIITPKSFLSMEISKDQLDESQEEELIEELIKEKFINELKEANNFIDEFKKFIDESKKYNNQEERRKIIHHLICKEYCLRKKLKDNRKQRFNMIQTFKMTKETLVEIMTKSKEFSDKITPIIKQYTENNLCISILLELRGSLVSNLYDINFICINQIQDSLIKEDKKQQMKVLKFTYKVNSVRRLLHTLNLLINNCQITETKYLLGNKEYNVLEMTTLIKGEIKEKLTYRIPKIVQEAISKCQLDQDQERKELFIKQLFKLSSTLRVQKCFRLSAILIQKSIYKDYLFGIIMKVIEILQTAEKNLQIETYLQIQINQLIHQFTITLEDVTQLENCTALEIRDKRSIQQ